MICCEEPMDSVESEVEVITKFLKRAAEDGRGAWAQPDPTLPHKVRRSSSLAANHLQDTSSIKNLCVVSLNLMIPAVSVP